MDEDVAQRIRDLEARVQHLEDERSIRELLARYGYNADTCRDEAYLDLFEDEAVMDFGAASPLVTRVEGKEQLRALIMDPSGHHGPWYGSTMHLQGNNLVVHVAGDEAVVNSYTLRLVRDPDGAMRLTECANNEWRVRRVDGSWRFVERRRRAVGEPEYTTNIAATPD